MNDGPAHRLWSEQQGRSVERRGVPVEIAVEADIRYDPDLVANTGGGTKWASVPDDFECLPTSW
jgi:hypothetical protein